jgi:hypothetical protein
MFCFSFEFEQILFSRLYSDCVLLRRNSEKVFGSKDFDGGTKKRVNYTNLLCFHARGTNVPTLQFRCTRFQGIKIKQKTIILTCLCVLTWLQHTKIL